MDASKSSIQDLLNTLSSNSFESQLTEMRPINDLDRECKEIWPDWNPQLDTSATDSYIFQEYSLTKDAVVRFAPRFDQEEQNIANKKEKARISRESYTTKKRELEKCRTEENMNFQPNFVDKDTYKNQMHSISQPVFNINGEEHILHKSNKDQIRKNIIFLSKMVNDLKKENLSLESEYESLKIQLDKSRQNRQKLTKKLRESNDAYKKMEEMHEKYRKLNFANPEYYENI